VAFALLGSVVEVADAQVQIPENSTAVIFFSLGSAWVVNQRRLRPGLIPKIKLIKHVYTPYFHFIALCHD